MAWFVLMAVANPGAVSPTDNYDITVIDAEGVDIFGGELNDLSATASQQRMPKIGSAYGARFVSGDALTFSLTNQSVNSATGRLVILHKD